mmetsp:Transcript_56371/g.125821  ORF Transcript_56371/g.125821 Transcript_56371/m.125821 type:complete len:232 (-) Transcript_56371:246-941(-)
MGSCRPVIYPHDGGGCLRFLHGRPRPLNEARYSLDHKWKHNDLIPTCHPQRAQIARIAASPDSTHSPRVHGFAKSVHELAETADAQPLGAARVTWPWMVRAYLALAFLAFCPAAIATLGGDLVGSFAPSATGEPLLLTLPPPLLSPLLTPLLIPSSEAFSRLVGFVSTSAAPSPTPAALLPAFPSFPALTAPASAASISSTFATAASPATSFPTFPALAAFPAVCWATPAA